MAKAAAMPPEQRQAQDGKAQAVERAAGCLLILLIILVIVLFAIFHPHGGGAAQAILSKIPGCGNISTADGNSFNDNTIAEGSCDLSNGASLRIYVWAAGDDFDQHDYVYQHTSCDPSVGPAPVNPTDGCFVGSNPTPWFIDIMSAAESDWTPVKNTLHGLHVTKPPQSWCFSNCPIPGQPGGGGGIHFGDGE